VTNGMSARGARRKMLDDAHASLASMEDALSILRVANGERELVDEIQKVVDEIRASLRAL